MISCKRDRSIIIDEKIGIDRISRKSNLKRNEKIRTAKDILARFILKFEDFGEGGPPRRILPRLGVLLCFLFDRYIRSYNISSRQYGRKSSVFEGHTSKSVARVHCGGMPTRVSRKPCLRMVNLSRCLKFTSLRGF